MDKEIQLNEHNKQEYPLCTHRRTYPEPDYGQNVRMPTLEKCTY